MDIFSIDVTPMEIAFIRQALDLISITGKDAKFLASLQVKVENQMAEIQKALDEKKPPSSTKK